MKNCIINTSKISQYYFFKKLQPLTTNKYYGIMSLDNVRNYVKTKLYEIIKDKDTDVKDTTERLEESIYISSIGRLDKLGFEQVEELPIEDLLFVYKELVVKVIINLHDNIDIAIEDPVSFPDMTREQLNEKKWSLLKTNRTEDIVKKKGAHRCPRCKSWFTEYIEIQTRAADEAATVKISCECGYHWKLN